MRHNLFTPMVGQLNYPHHTKMERGVVHVVTNPKTPIKVNDIIYLEGDMSSVGIPDHKVVEVLEHRLARGQHSVPFEPIFQKLRVESTFNKKPKK